MHLLGVASIKSQCFSFLSYDLWCRQRYVGYVKGWLPMLGLGYFGWSWQQLGTVVRRFHYLLFLSAAADKVKGLSLIHPMRTWLLRSSLIVTVLVVNTNWHVWGLGKVTINRHWGWFVWVKAFIGFTVLEFTIAFRWVWLPEPAWPKPIQRKGRTHASALICSAKSEAPY